MPPPAPRSAQKPACEHIGEGVTLKARPSGEATAHVPGQSGDGGGGGDAGGGDGGGGDGGGGLGVGG